MNAVAGFDERLEQALLSLEASQRDRLLRCCQSGVEERDSDIGCYLLRPSDLNDLGVFFGPLIRDIHQTAAGTTPPGRWPLDTSDPVEVCDFAELGMAPMSMRVRVARTVGAFSLPASMDRAERVRFERTMTSALQAVIDHPDYGGRVYSLTPEFGPSEPNPRLIGPAEHQALAATGVMFRDMTRDRFMKSAGLAGDWPYGRACYVSLDRSLIVWIGEEDHPRIICMKTGTRLSDVFARLGAFVRVLESQPGMSFVRDSQFGYVTSCPSNLGTGMRASLHVTLPGLVRAGIDIRRACAEAGLTVNGPGGERTPVNAGGVLEVSPIRRAFVRERDILSHLFEGVRRLSQLAAL